MRGFRAAIDLLKARTGVINISHKGIHAVAKHLLGQTMSHPANSGLHVHGIIPRSADVGITSADGTKRTVRAHIYEHEHGFHPSVVGGYAPSDGSIHIHVSPGKHDRHELHRRVRSVLAHEFTHAADPGVASAVRRGNLPNPSSENVRSMKHWHNIYGKYINHHTEMAAHMQQIHREVTTPRAVASVRSDPQGMHPERLVALHSSTYASLSERMTPDNRKRVLKMVARAHDAAREGTISDEESKFRRAIGTLNGW